MKEYEIPKAFWKDYDLFRRKQITIEQFSCRAKLTKKEIRAIIQLLKKESGKMLFS